MKVCLLNDSFPPLIDGVANTVVNYAENLTATGNEVCVATPQYPGVTDDCAYEVVRYPSVDTTKLIGYRAGVPFEAESLEKLTSFGADIYHTHCPVASTILARTLRETAPAPVVFTYHTKFDIDIANAVRSHMLQTAACTALVKNVEACDEVWVVSDGAGKNLRSLGFEGDYRIMHNGVDFPKGLPDQDAVQAVRAAHGVPEGVPLFLFVGRMMWYKGLRLVMDALRGLRDAEFDFRMMFVGGGMDAEEMKAYSEELRIADRCIFVGAVNDREKLRAYFGAADLFLFLSDFDTNGIVVREAAACGLGSLLLRDSAAAEDIVHKDTGFLTERNAAAVAAQLTELCCRPALMKEVGRSAMDKIYYSWQDSVACAAARYAQIADDYRSGRLQLKRGMLDPVFDAAADINEALDRAKGLPSRLKKGMSNFMQEFERYI